MIIGNSFLTLFHILVILLLFSLPLYPSNYMYIVRWIPIALIINWFIFDGCPLTFLDKKLDDREFIEYLISPIVKLSKQRMNNLLYLFIFIIFFFCNKKYYKHFYLNTINNLSTNS